MVDNVGLNEKKAFKQRLEHGSRVRNSRNMSMGACETSKQQNGQ